MNDKALSCKDCIEQHFKRLINVKRKRPELDPGHSFEADAGVVSNERDVNDPVAPSEDFSSETLGFNTGDFIRPKLNGFVVTNADKCEFAAILSNHGELQSFDFQPDATTTAIKPLSPKQRKILLGEIRLCFPEPSTADPFCVLHSMNRICSVVTGNKGECWHVLHLPRPSHLPPSSLMKSSVVSFLRRFYCDGHGLDSNYGEVLTVGPNGTDFLYDYFMCCPIVSIDGGNRLRQRVPMNLTTGGLAHRSKWIGGHMPTWIGGGWQASRFEEFGE